MAYWDRFDICEAHKAVEDDYNVGGIVRERPSNARRNMSTGFQLARMGFEAGVCWDGFRGLSENAKDIYHELVKRWGLPIPDCCQCPGGEYHSDECEHRCEESYCENYEVEHWGESEEQASVQELVKQQEKGGLEYGL